MLSDIRDLWRLLTPPQRLSLLSMQALMIAASLLELLGVSAVFPFLGALAQPRTVAVHPITAALCRHFGCTDASEAVVLAAILLLTLTVVTNTVHLLNVGLANHLAQRLSAEFSSRLYDYYLSRDLLYHAARNTSVLASRAVNDTERVSRLFLTSLLKLNGRLFVIVALSGLLLWINAPVALAALAVLAAAYSAILRVVRRRVLADGREVAELNARRLRQFSEGLSGLREVKMSGAEAACRDAFAATSRRVGLQSARMATIAAFPYYLLETLAICGMVAIVLLHAGSDGGIAAALPVSGLFAMAGYKLLPAFQQSYHALTEIRSAEGSFAAIRDDLVRAGRTVPERSRDALVPVRTLGLDRVTVRYEGRSEAVLCRASVALPVGKATVLLGPSGGGKSTVLELLVGLIAPLEGHVLADGRRLEGRDFVALRAAVGYVPQSIFLSDATLAENIAFGVPASAIDPRRLERAARVAGLAEWIDRLPGGYGALAGERGVQLSGGQLQRVGLARALYLDPPIIILDEATAALDRATEREVLTALRAAAAGKTLLFATHRGSAIRLADCVVWVDRGTLTFYESVDRFLADKGWPLDRRDEGLETGDRDGDAATMPG